MNSKKLKGAERRTTWTCKGILLIFCLFTLFPILFVLNTSLKETSEFYENVWGIPKEFAWGNYYYAWDTAQIGTYFFNSLLVVGITVLGNNCDICSGRICIGKTWNQTCRSDCNAHFFEYNAPVRVYTYADISYDGKIGNDRDIFISDNTIHRMGQCICNIYLL